MAFRRNNFTRKKKKRKFACTCFQFSFCADGSRTSTYISRIAFALSSHARTDGVCERRYEISFSLVKNIFLWTNTDQHPTDGSWWSRRRQRRRRFIASHIYVHLFRVLRCEQNTLFILFPDTKWKSLRFRSSFHFSPHSLRSFIVLVDSRASCVTYIKHINIYPHRIQIAESYTICSDTFDIFNDVKCSKKPSILHVYSCIYTWFLRLIYAWNGSILAHSRKEKYIHQQSSHRVRKTPSVGCAILPIRSTWSCCGRWRRRRREKKIQNTRTQSNQPSIFILNEKLKIEMKIWLNLVSAAAAAANSSKRSCAQALVEKKTYHTKCLHVSTRQRLARQFFIG